MYSCDPVQPRSLWALLNTVGLTYAYTCIGMGCKSGLKEHESDITGKERSIQCQGRHPHMCTIAYLRTEVQWDGKKTVLLTRQLFYNPWDLVPSKHRES